MQGLYGQSEHHALLLTRSADSVDITSIRSAPELFSLDLGTLNRSRAYPMIETFSEGNGRTVLAERLSVHMHAVSEVMLL